MLTQLNADWIIQACNNIPKKKVSESYWLLCFIKEKFFKKGVMLGTLSRRRMNDTSLLYLFIEMKKVSTKLRNVEFDFRRVSIIEAIKFCEDFFLIIPCIHCKNCIENIVSLWLSKFSIFFFTISAFVFDKVLNFLPLTPPLFLIKDVIKNTLKSNFWLWLFLNQVYTGCSRVSRELKKLTFSSSCLGC